MAISFEGGTVQVEAGLIAKGLQIDEAALREGMQQGLITTLCERGEGEDAGRFRLTFFSPTRRLRLVVGADGAVLQSSTAPFQRRKPSAG